MQIAFHGSDGKACVIVFGGVEGDLGRKIQRSEGLRGLLAGHLANSGRGLGDGVIERALEELGTCQI